jgi:hypothetical protein
MFEFVCITAGYWQWIEKKKELIIAVDGKD